MSIFLFVIGALALMAGLATIAFGLPINEFSFGNTLIMVGTTATIGGLIVIALGAVVGQLQRIAKALAEHAPAQAGLPLERVEVSAEPPVVPAARVPFPPKPLKDSQTEPLVIRPLQPPESSAEAPPKTEEKNHEETIEKTSDGYPGESFAPTLPNPEASQLVATATPWPADLAAPSEPAVPSAESKSSPEPAIEPPWRSALPPPPPLPPRPKEAPASPFDAMWPSETKPPRSETPSMAKQDQSTHEPTPASTDSESSGQPHRAAILKSGVVDGMGYTLYVDGSIEAELPQGTLHFASIEELRAHLEKNP